MNDFNLDYIKYSRDLLLNVTHNLQSVRFGRYKTCRIPIGVVSVSF